MAASPHVVIQNWIEQRSPVRGNLQGMPFGAELKIELIEAGAHQRPIMENLLQLYIHDFSEMVPLEIGEDGRYEYKDLNRYWSDPGRWPFLAKLGGKLAGLVLVTTAGGGDRYDMAEFFVLRSYRHRGVGRELAEKVWLRFPGPWQIRVREQNVAALKFWASSITRFTGRVADSSTFQLNGINWHSFSFDSTLMDGQTQQFPKKGERWTQSQEDDC
jgi:predicted acetyltransferase